MVALRGARRTTGRVAVERRRPVGVTGPRQQVGAHGQQPVVLPQRLVESVERAETGERAVDLADDDRAAQRGERVVGERDQLVVPGEDLRPVGLLRPLGVVVERGDRGLHLVLAAAVARQRRLEDADPFGDLARVPAAPVLLVERHEGAVLVARASRRASWSSISASIPATSGSSDSRASSRVSRIASAARSTRPP